MSLPSDELQLSCLRLREIERVALFRHRCATPESAANAFTSCGEYWSAMNDTVFAGGNYLANRRARLLSARRIEPRFCLSILRRERTIVWIACAVSGELLIGKAGKKREAQGSPGNRFWALPHIFHRHALLFFARILSRICRGFREQAFSTFAKFLAEERPIMSSLPH